MISKLRGKRIINEINKLIYRNALNISESNLTDKKI
jgi:hypothetical protein